MWAGQGYVDGTKTGLCSLAAAWSPRAGLGEREAPVGADPRGGLSRLRAGGPGPRVQEGRPWEASTQLQGQPPGGAIVLGLGRRREDASAKAPVPRFPAPSHQLQPVLGPDGSQGLPSYPLLNRPALHPGLGAGVSGHQGLGCTSCRFVGQTHAGRQLHPSCPPWAPAWTPCGGWGPHCHAAPVSGGRVCILVCVHHLAGL